MRKAFLITIITLTVLTMGSCSKETQDQIANEYLNNSTTGMTLIANVNKPSNTKASIGGTSDWQFSFEKNDIVRVNNSEHAEFYTFTKGTENFTSSDAISQYLWP